MGEAQGWASASVQVDDQNPGSKGKLVRTPNLEKIVGAGVCFAELYAASPRCTPTRAALFTGKHSHFAAFPQRARAVRCGARKKLALVDEAIACRVFIGV
jgi:arylsulfatase A-like enzyme